MAIAAPATPAFSTTTKKISPAIFRQTETANMTSGVTVSPSALSAAAHASYKNVATSPAIIIKYMTQPFPSNHLIHLKIQESDAKITGTIPL